MAPKSLTLSSHIVLLGDSITASYAYNTSPGAAGTGWYNGAQARAGHPFLPPVNAGVGSNTTTQMLTRLTSDVLAFDADTVHVLGGHNDVAAGTAAATVLANLESICDQLVADGRSVLLGTLYPTLAIQSDGTLSGILSTVNDGIRTYAAATAGVTVVDYNAAMSADGTTIDDAGYWIDNVHPSKAGSAVMAQTLAPVL